MDLNEETTCKTKLVVIVAGGRLGGGGRGDVAKKEGGCSRDTSMWRLTAVRI